MYLWVRNTVHGDTKTAASVRIVPLLEHLSEAEAGVIEQLLGYAEAGYAGEPLVPLMAESIGQRALLDRYGAASYLHALLRQLTGDNSLRYHHMRHGWVTRIAAWQHGLEVPGFNRDEMLNALAWRTFIGDGVSAYPLRSLATAVGHANGATTLASYTHSVELIAQASLRRTAPVLDDFGQAYALQIAYATIRRRRNRGPHSGRPAAIPVPDIATVQRKRPVLSTWHRQAAALPLSLVVVDRFLRRYGSPGGSLRAARDLLIPQAQAAELLHRAVRLENASGYHGYGLARHSDDPLVRAGDRGDRSRQFRREDQRMSSLLSGLDQQLEAQPTSSMRRNLAKGLLEFHGHLQKTFAYPPISPYSTLGIGKTPQFVDAQILNEDQYRLVLRDLATGPLSQRSPRLAIVAQAMMIFGFRLGLRRNEALKLLRRDLQLPSLPDARAAAVRRRHQNLKRLSPGRFTVLERPINLLIRPHAQRTLKTRNSTRTLQLHVLLEPDELQLIERLAQLRDDEELKSPYSEFLFCIPEFQTRWVSESTLMPAIHDALRRVTGCSDMHYHHLRHSAATWLTFKLAASAFGISQEAGLLFGEHPQTMKWLLGTERFNRAFLHSPESATRRVIHITSAVLGHASPKTSLLYYIHCMPWLSALCWQWNPEFWPPGHVIAKIAQVSLPNKPDDLPAPGLPAEIRHMRRIIGRMRVYRRSNQGKIKRPLISHQRSDGGWALTRMNEISSMLSYEAYAEASGQSVNMDWVEFTEADRSAMLERARYISHLGKHRLQSPAISDSDNRIELVPRPPKHGGLAGVVAYADQLYRLLSSRHKAKAGRVLDDFVERCWASETTLRFYPGRDDQSAREYLWLLYELGVPWADIEFIIYDDRTPRQTKSRWRTVLGKPRLRFIEQVPENRSSQNSHIGIRVMLRLPGAKPTAQEHNHHSGAALRYLMLMASIDWHFRA